jgi:hypothetical protein
MMANLFMSSIGLQMIPHLKLSANGVDRTASHTTTSYVQWTDNAYFLGANKNWKVTEISEKQIYMLPADKTANDILWRSSDANSWEAVLKTSKQENRYVMERVKTFE